MAPEDIVKAVEAYLVRLAASGLSPVFAVIFGSQVRGDAVVWSDIDVVVVSPVFDVDKSRESVNKLWRAAARVDTRIEPVACGLEEWAHDDSRALLEVARRGGQVVQPPLAG